MLGITSKALQEEGQIPAKVASEFRAFINKIAQELEVYKSPEKLAFLILARTNLKDFNYCLIRTQKLYGKDLSTQQIKIALLVAQGFTNKEIAERMGIKRGTVNSHIIQIYNKLNINNRVALARHIFFSD